MKSLSYKSASVPVSSEMQTDVPLQPQISLHEVEIKKNKQFSASVVC